MSSIVGFFLCLESCLAPSGVVNATLQRKGFHVNDNKQVFLVLCLKSAESPDIETSLPLLGGNQWKYSTVFGSLMDTTYQQFIRELLMTGVGGLGLLEKMLSIQWAIFI